MIRGLPCQKCSHAVTKTPSLVMTHLAATQACESRHVPRCMSISRTHPEPTQQATPNGSFREGPKDQRPMTFARFNARSGKPKPVTVKCPLDSGASGSLIDAKFTKKLRVKRASTTTVWSTPAGEMSTSTMVTKPRVGQQEIRAEPGRREQMHL